MENTTAFEKRFENHKERTIDEMNARIRMYRMGKRKKGFEIVGLMKKTYDLHHHKS